LVYQIHKGRARILEKFKYFKLKQLPFEILAIQYFKMAADRFKKITAFA
jgi:hypothetical protein